VSKRLLINPGQRFGKLVTIRPALSSAMHGSRWLCLCDCKSEYIARAAHLMAGEVASCGCVKSIHRKSHLPEYGIWNSMVRRCTNQGDTRWDRYGGRGIKVCDRWLGSFENFLSDMGPRPSADFQIERKNNDGNYEPDNCCWIHRRLQARNKQTNVFLTHDGVTLTIAEWADKTGLRAPTISGRLARGWTIQRALATSPAYRGPNKHSRLGSRAILTLEGPQP
jgi:hypothetical protein